MSSLPEPLSWWSPQVVGCDPVARHGRRDAPLRRRLRFWELDRLGPTYALPRLPSRPPFRLYDFGEAANQGLFGLFQLQRVHGIYLWVYLFVLNPVGLPYARFRWGLPFITVSPGIDSRHTLAQPHNRLPNSTRWPSYVKGLTWGRCPMGGDPRQLRA